MSFEGHPNSKKGVWGEGVAKNERIKTLNMETNADVRKIYDFWKFLAFWMSPYGWPSRSFESIHPKRVI